MRYWFWGLFTTCIASIVLIITHIAGSQISPDWSVANTEVFSHYPIYKAIIDIVKETDNVTGQSAWLETFYAIGSGFGAYFTHKRLKKVFYK